ncbi:hypothetical protein M5689_012273 [Euphorbia peplus]|nr:hypothetical protein M5689_012273 [Euphorbia peplus]
MKLIGFKKFCYNEASLEAFVEHSSSEYCYQVKKMVARMMYLGDEEANPPIIHHVGDMNIPGSSDDYNKCIEAGGPSGVFNSGSENQG